MNEKIVYIDKSDEDTFYNVLKLISDGNISSFKKTNTKVSVKKLDGEDAIIYNDIAYMLSQKDNSYRELEYGFGKNGANWFGMLRGEKVETSNSGWKELIGNITEEFHGQYSVFTFEPEARSNESKIKDKSLMNDVLKKFFGGRNLRPQVNSTSVKRDIYGAVLKMEVTDGPKVPQTILCKIFFKKVGQSLEIVGSNEAKLINDSFLNSVENDKDESINVIKNTNVTKIAEEVSNELDKLFQTNEFSKCYILHHEIQTNKSDLRFETDQEVINNIIANAPAGDTVEIYVRKVTLLSIIQAKWEEASYIVIDEDSQIPVLKFEMGVDGVFSLKCIACKNGEYLIENNQIYDEDNDIFIDYKQFMDNKLDISKIKTSFSKHLNVKVNCELISSYNGKNNCNRWVCECNVDANKKCLNCHKAEIIFPLGKTKLPTKSIAYDSLKKEFAYIDQLKACKCCERKFSVLATKDYCEFCNNCIESSYSEEEELENKKTYKTYKKLLPFARRIFSKGKRFAIEDEEIILIKLGTKVYFVNKLKELNKIKAVKKNFEEEEN